VKTKIGVTALLIGLAWPLSGPAQAYRIAYGSGIRGEIEPCG
jgi:hypothetical protein